MREAKRVCVIAYEGFDPFAYGLFLEVFGRPNPGVSGWYQCKTVAALRGIVMGQYGVSIQVENGFESLKNADIIVVPGWERHMGCGSEGLRREIQNANAREARIVAISSGTYLLASCNIVQGKQIVIPPNLMQEFQDQFPNVQMNTTSVYAESGNLVTAAGTAAGLDMALYIAKQDFGTKAANRIARRLVMPVYRDGQQAQYIARALPSHASGHIGSLLEELRDNLDTDWNIETLSKLANTSRRTLQRRFKDATGHSPQVWLINERIDLSKDLLETTNLNVQQIANRTGMKTPETFRHHFKRIVGTTPTRYRTKMQAHSGVRS